MARVFTTLVEEMKAIGLGQLKPDVDKPECTDATAPVALKDRSPVLFSWGMAWEPRRARCPKTSS